MTIIYLWVVFIFNSKKWYRLFSEILQFKSEHADKRMFHEHDEMVVQEKPEPIMINRNQYSTGDETDDGFSFSARNDDINSAVKKEGFEFRYHDKMYLICASQYKINIYIEILWDTSSEIYLVSDSFFHCIMHMLLTYYVWESVNINYREKKYDTNLNGKCAMHDKIMLSPGIHPIWK